MATLSHGDQKRLASMKFAPILKEKVDLNLVKIEVIHKHIENTLPKYLPDEILVQTFIESLNVGAGETLNPQLLQLSLEALISPKPAAKYTEELWRLLLSAQESKTGVAEEIIKAKVADLRKAQNNDEKVIGRRANDSKPEQQPNKSRREEASTTGEGDEESILNRPDSSDLPNDRARAPRRLTPPSRNRGAARRGRSPAPRDRSPAPRDRSFSPRKRSPARRGHSPSSRNNNPRHSELRRRSPAPAPQLRSRNRDPRGRDSRSPPDLRKRSRRDSSPRPRSRTPPYRRNRRVPSPRGYDSYRPAIRDYRDERPQRHDDVRRPAEKRKHRYSPDEDSVPKKGRQEREHDTGKETTGRKETIHEDTAGDRRTEDTATPVRKSTQPQASAETGAETEGVENGVGDEIEKVETTKQ